MNPICPTCHSSMVLRKYTTQSRIAETKKHKPVLGRAKFWCCKNCKTRYKVGAEVIRPKPAYEPFSLKETRPVTSGKPDETN